MPFELLLPFFKEVLGQYSGIEVFPCIRSFGFAHGFFATQDCKDVIHKEIGRYAIKGAVMYLEIQAVLLPIGKGIYRHRGFIFEIQLFEVQFAFFLCWPFTHGLACLSPLNVAWSHPGFFPAKVFQMALDSGAAYRIDLGKLLQGFAHGRRRDITFSVHHQEIGHGHALIVKGQP